MIRALLRTLGYSRSRIGRKSACASQSDDPPSPAWRCAGISYWPTREGRPKSGGEKSQRIPFEYLVDKQQI